jgi:hypothetical protein
MSFGVLDAMEDDENGKEDENPCVITLHEETDKKSTPTQLRNQMRVKNEIKDFVLRGLGGVPDNYSRLESKRLWGNRWRVNVVTIDKNGNANRPHSYFIHYQKDHITCDKLTPLVQLYNNYQTVFSNFSKEVSADASHS